MSSLRSQHSPLGPGFQGSHVLHGMQGGHYSALCWPPGQLTDWCGKSRALSSGAVAQGPGLPHLWHTQPLLAIETGCQGSLRCCNTWGNWGNLQQTRGW